MKGRYGYYNTNPRDAKVYPPKDQRPLIYEPVPLRSDGKPCTTIAKRGPRPEVYPDRQPDPKWWEAWGSPGYLNMKWWEVGR